MAKCLVTGCAGFIGSNLVDRLLKDGHKVIGVDNLSTGLLENLPNHKNFRFEKCDISDLGKFYYALSQIDNIDIVFHVAANARIQPCINDPSLALNNIKQTFSVLELMRTRGIKRIVFSSSSSIYGKNKIPFKEDMKSDCLNPYSFSKFTCEEMIKTYCKLYNIQGVSLRYFNVWGPREYIDGEYGTVIGKFFRQVLKNKVPLTIINDGSMRRDFTYIDDVVEANILAMKALRGKYIIYKGDVFNVGTGKNYSIEEVSDMILESCHENGNYKRHTDARPGECNETLADISYIGDFWGWKPTVCLKDRINQHRDYYKKKWNL